MKRSKTTVRSLPNVFATYRQVFNALWHQHRLAVEINGYGAHSSPWAHDRDHRKEQDLRARGLDVRRFTALQAIDEPALVIAGIAVALAQKR